MIAIFLALLASIPATAAPSCGDRLIAYTVYEEFENGKIQQKHSFFPVGDWSDASAFDGLLLSGPTTASLDVVLRQQAKRTVKRYSFSAWELDPAYSQAEGFAPKNFFKDADSGDSFTFRLKEDGKTACEDTYEIQGD
jgi:hypothetical protein